MSCPFTFTARTAGCSQLAANIHQVLRYGLLFHEVKNKIGASIPVRIGEVISNRHLQEFGDPFRANAYLKEATLRLA
jgi:hypothetical protein